MQKNNRVNVGMRLLIAECREQFTGGVTVVGGLVAGFPVRISLPALGIGAPGPAGRRPLGTATPRFRRDAGAVLLRVAVEGVAGDGFRMLARLFEVGP